jgi:SAM-dependent methyltransferase
MTQQIGRLAGERSAQILSATDPPMKGQNTEELKKMNFFDLVNISESYMEVVNPSTPEKMVKLGKFLRLQPDSRIIDFGSGYAETLILWAEQFGICGVGVEIREPACIRSRNKIADKGLNDRIEIVCAAGAEYVFQEGTFDAATCLGASFIWGGFQQTIQAMRRAIRPGGRLGIGEPYWLRAQVPVEYAQQEPSIHSEVDLLKITRQEGFDFDYVVRASHDDWDRYEADNWHGLVRWIEAHPGHPERAEVIDHLHRIQDNYVKYGREYLGWAMYVLAPKDY